MASIQEILDSLFQAGFASRDSIRGLSNDEIEEIEIAQGVSLPKTIRQYLKTLGGHACSAFSEDNMSMPNLLSNKARFFEYLMHVDQEVSLKSPKEIYVFFADSQSCWFYFCYCDSAEDPEVFRLDETQTPAISPTGILFTDFILHLIARYKNWSVGLTGSFNP
jgi:SMI1-KNR4 cell-wall